MWVRNVDDEMTTLKDEEIRNKFTSFCREKAQDMQIPNNLVTYLGYSSRFWNKHAI